MLVIADKLTKMYGDTVGCRDICLSLEEGQVFGLLGPNGAGKSTLVKMFLGLIRPTSGMATIAGKPVNKVGVRERVGYLPELFRFYEWLSAWEMMWAWSRLYRLPPGEEKTAIMRTLDLVGLKGREHEKIKGYSKGMQQRLGLAGAIFHNPDLVFLDEPTSALDPMGRREVRNIISYLKDKGTTVFLNSHLLTEAEMTCTHLGFIKKGILFEQGDINKYLYSAHDINMEVEGIRGDTLAFWQAEEKLVEYDGRRLVIRVEGEEEIPRVVTRLAAEGARIYRVQSRQLGLEEVFLSLVND